MKRLIIFAFLALSPLAAFAQGGSDALPFIRTDLGGTLTGTAGAAVASPDAGAWSAFRSAAVIPASDGTGSAGIDARVAGELPGGAASFLLKLTDNIGFAAGVMYQSGDKIGDFRTSDKILSAGAGIGVTEKLSVGVNARFAKQSLTSSVAYSGISMDLSLMDRLSDAVSTIAGVSALGGKVTSASGTEYSQPANAYAGTELRLNILDGVFSADAMAEYYLSGSYAAAVGASFTYQETVSVRGGFRYASPWCVMPTRFAFGAGYIFSGLSVDVSYARMSSQNIISLGIGYKIQ